MDLKFLLEKVLHRKEGYEPHDAEYHALGRVTYLSPSSNHQSSATVPPLVVVASDITSCRRVRDDCALYIRASKTDKDIDGRVVGRADITATRTP